MMSFQRRVQTDETKVAVKLPLEKQILHEFRMGMKRVETLNCSCWTR